ncbi:toxin-antitoxin system HicB family antitoxin [Aquibium sp. LZ166]|uniref:Toxin-antitoxin system HicB family antitoxin n=1 Tax=Aquibium pacificus TaxID=3153579 RepID=A0ABV3SG07_9HYPH
MNKSKLALRLQPSLKSAAERVAAAEGPSLNQFINIAVAEKLSALETESYFRSRAGSGGRKAFDRFLDEGGTVAPVPGDELPEEY